MYSFHELPAWTHGNAHKLKLWFIQIVCGSPLVILLVFSPSVYFFIKQVWFLAWSWFCHLVFTSYPCTHLRLECEFSFLLMLLILLCLIRYFSTFWFQNVTQQTPTWIFLILFSLIRNINRHSSRCRAGYLHHGDVKNTQIQSSWWLSTWEPGPSECAGQVAHDIGVFVRTADYVGTRSARRAASPWVRKCGREVKFWIRSRRLRPTVYGNTILMPHLPI